MAKLGVAAAWGVEADEATEIGKEKAAKARARGSRARAAKASERGAADGTFPTSGRDAASRAAVAALLRPPSGPLRVQVFAATQLVGVFHSAPGPAAGSSDPSGGARARRDGGDASGSARGRARARARFRRRGDRRRREREGRDVAFVFDVCGGGVARVGPTHASRLAAVRWTPWAGARAQSLQDAAALVALKDVVPHLLRAEGIEVEEEETEDGGREEKSKGRDGEGGGDGRAGGGGARAVAGSGG